MRAVNRISGDYYWGAVDNKQVLAPMVLFLCYVCMCVLASSSPHCLSNGLKSRRKKRSNSHHINLHKTVI
jgi:hypothetical protein